MLKFEEEDKKELTATEVVDMAKYLYEIDEISSKDLMEFMVETEIVDYVKGRGFAFVKLQTMEQQTKFQQFAETELWPDYNQQRKNISI